MSGDAADAPAGVLAGRRVIDAASYIAGPVAATVMADFGAKVVKIEPPAGDPFRGLPETPDYPPSPHNDSRMVDNRNKRSLALDLRRRVAGRPARGTCPDFGYPDGVSDTSQGGSDVGG